MSVAERPFNDSRNVYIVDNNDPKAFDKRFVGIPGTHPEYRCCGDKAPYMTATFMRGGGLDSKGRLIKDYPEVQNGSWLPFRVYSASQREGIALDSHPGVSDEAMRRNFSYLRDELWCHECSTALETAWSGFLEGLTDSVPVWRAVAMVMSYVPVIGTAVSFIINTSVTLAVTGEIDSALLDGIGGALPGQPVSGVVFNTVRSVVRGDHWDKTLLNDALIGAGLSPLAQTLIDKACDILVDISNGKTIENVALDEVRKTLPPAGQKLMDLGRALASGQDVSDITLMAADAATSIPGSGAPETARNFRAAALAAKEKGEAAVNSFVAQIAFMGALLPLAEEVRNALMAGAVGGLVEKHQLIGAFDSSEKNVTGNDAFAAKGQALMASGVTYGGKRLSDITSASSLSITHQAFDALSGTYQPRQDTYVINDQWRRGFAVALGYCEGLMADSHDQAAVRASLGNLNAQQGFDAGQAIQFFRSLHSVKNLAITQKAVTSSASSHAAAFVTASPFTKLASSASRAALFAVAPHASQPVVAPTKPAAPLVMDSAVYAQKTADRARWVDYYAKLA